MASTVESWKLDEMFPDLAIKVRSLCERVWLPQNALFSSCKKCGCMKCDVAIRKVQTDESSLFFRTQQKILQYMDLSTPYILTWFKLIEIRMLTESMRRNVLYITVSQHDSGIFEAVRQGYSSCKMIGRGWEADDFSWWKLMLVRESEMLASCD